MSEAVDSWGAQIVSIAEQEAAARLAQGDLPAGICDLRNLPKTQALARRYGITISLLGAADAQNPTLAQKEREVLDAYVYNAEKSCHSRAISSALATRSLSIMRPHRLAMR